MSSCLILLNGEKIDPSYGVLDVIVCRVEHGIHALMPFTPQAPVSILKQMWTLPSLSFRMTLGEQKEMSM